MMKPIPRIFSWPVVGNAVELSRDILGFLEFNFKRHGDTFLFKMPMNKSVLSTRNAEVFKHILQTHHKNYRKDYGNNMLKLALGNGLLTNEGESWFRQRRLAQPAFYKKRLEGFFDTMVSFTQQHIDGWKKGQVTVVMIDQEMMQLTSKIVIETLLGSDISGKLSQFQNYIYLLQGHLVKLIRQPFYQFSSKLTGEEKQFNDTIRDFDAILYEVIKNRKNQAPKNDLLSMLMDARDEDTGEGMSDKQLRDELLTIYVAGHETSGYTLAWAMYNLCKHPEVYKTAKAEVQMVMADGILDMDNFKKLGYLKNVIDETLRLYPTAYLLSRESKHEDKIGDMFVPADVITLLSVYYLHRNPKYWKQADEFIPERFEGNNNVLFSHDAYYPFGAGPRMCIGFYFATMEITIVLAHLLYHFDFELVKDHPIAFEPLVTLKPKYGIKLNIKANEK
jgi:cytochrome P450